MDYNFDLTICIVNWNTQSLLRDCLVSILEGKWNISYEIVVVDNNSADSSVAMLREEFPQVVLISNQENVGFAKANNQAFARAQGRYVLLLNSDTVVLPRALDLLIDFIDKHAEAGAVGCKLLNMDGSMQRSCWRGYPNFRSAVIDAFYLWRLFPWLPMVRESEIGGIDLEDPIEVDHILGACMLVSRDVLDQTNGMDESIFLFLEETDWCYRIKKLGWKIFFYPAAQVIHFGQQSVQKQPQRTLPEKYRNYVWFYRKYENPSALKIWALKFVIVFAGLLRIGLWTWRSRNASQRDLAHGMRDGYGEVVKQALFF